MKEEIEKLENKIEELEDRIRELEDDNYDLKEDLDDYKYRLDRNKEEENFELFEAIELLSELYYNSTPELMKRVEILLRNNLKEYVTPSFLV